MGLDVEIVRRSMVTCLDLSDAHHYLQKVSEVDGPCRVS